MSPVDFVAIARAGLEASGADWERLAEGERRALVTAAKTAYLTERAGPPAKTETYAEWLAAQPAEVQALILGPDKSEKFRSGKLRVERFTGVAGGGMSLDDLAAARPEVPRRSGVNPDDKKGK